MPNNESKIEGGATESVDLRDIEKQESCENNLCGLGSGEEDLKVIVVSPNKDYLSRSASSQEQCRYIVCLCFFCLPIYVIL